MNKTTGSVVLALVIFVGISVLFSFPIMLLWNYCLVPAAPMLVEITWLQAWGIHILFNILFKPSGISKILERS